MKSVANKTIGYKFYPNTKKRIQAIRGLGSNDFYPVYCQLTYNRHTTRFPLSSIPGFKGVVLADFSFDLNDFQNEERLIKQAIDFEIGIIGQKKYSISGLADRLRYYYNEVKSYLPDKVYMNSLQELGDILTYNEFTKMEKHLFEYNSSIIEKYPMLQMEFSYKFIDLLILNYLLVIVLEKDVRKIVSTKAMKESSAVYKFIEYCLMRKPQENKDSYLDIPLLNIEWHYDLRIKKAFKSFLSNDTESFSRRVELDGVDIYSLFNDSFIKHVKFENTDEIIDIVDRIIKEDETFIEFKKDQLGKNLID